MTYVLVLVLVVLVLEQNIAEFLAVVLSLEVEYSSGDKLEEERIDAVHRHSLGSKDKLPMVDIVCEQLGQVRCILKRDRICFVHSPTEGVSTQEIDGSSRNNGHRVVAMFF